MTTAAVILAAGAGRRFGAEAEKLRTCSGGRSLLAWALAPAIAAGLDELIVVTGAADLSALVPDAATVLHNPRWSGGQATSLQVALDWCRRQGHGAAVVGLGDLPGLTVSAWRAVAHAPGGPIVVATYQGRRGHPVRLDSEVWALVPTDGEQGARLVMAERPELVTEVACEGRPDDVDTPEDLRRWS